MPQDANNRTNMVLTSYFLFEIIDSKYSARIKVKFRDKTGITKNKKSRKLNCSLLLEYVQRPMTNMATVAITIGPGNPLPRLVSKSKNVPVAIINIKQAIPTNIIKYKAPKPEVRFSKNFFTINTYHSKLLMVNNSSKFFNALFLVILLSYNSA